MISFSGESLIFSVRIAGEKEEYVYLKITPAYLLVSCSVDTDESYLSLNAYLLLDKYISCHYEVDFSEYYWPDFFNLKTGKSRYLSVRKKGKSLSVKLKTKYRFFYKPGIIMPEIAKDNINRNIEISIIPSEPETEDKNTVIAYCILNPVNHHFCNGENRELTLLIPFLATLNNNQRTFKSLVKYVTLENSHFFSGVDEVHYELSEICFEMWENSLFYQMKRSKTNGEIKSFQERNAKQFDLWSRVLPLLVRQKFISYQFVYGLRYIKGKPRKTDFIPCQVLSEVPILKFYLIDRGEHYSFGLQFMVYGKLHSFAKNLLTYYFVASDAEPEKFHLLGSKNDADIVNYFARINFSILVLKKHYLSHFKVFADQIKTAYGLIEK